MGLQIEKFDCTYWKVGGAELYLNQKYLEIRLHGYRDEAERRAGLQPSASATIQRPVSNELLDRIAGGGLSLTDAAYKLLRTSHLVDAGDAENPVEANDWLGAVDLLER